MLPLVAFEAAELTTGAFSKICEAGLLAPPACDAADGNGSAEVAGAAGPIACLFCCGDALLPADFVAFKFGVPRPGVLAGGGFTGGLVAALFGDAPTPAPAAGVPAPPPFGCGLLPLLLLAAFVDGAAVGFVAAGSVPFGIAVEL